MALSRGGQAIRGKGAGVHSIARRVESGASLNDGLLSCLCRYASITQAERKGMLRYTPEDLVRFFSKVGTTTVCDCWLWEGGTSCSGYSGNTHYGSFHMIWKPVEEKKKGNRRKQTAVYAHRFAYEIFKGPIPDGITIEHTCTRHLCVNPEHLILATQTENTEERNERRGLPNPYARTQSWICPSCKSNGSVPADTKKCTVCGIEYPNAEEELMPARVDDGIPI